MFENAMLLNSGEILAQKPEVAGRVSVLQRFDRSFIYSYIFKMSTLCTPFVIIFIIVARC